MPAKGFAGDAVTAAPAGPWAGRRALMILRCFRTSSDARWNVPGSSWNERIGRASHEQGSVHLVVWAVGWGQAQQQGTATAPGTQSPHTCSSADSSPSSLVICLSDPRFFAEGSRWSVGRLPDIVSRNSFERGSLGSKSRRQLRSSNVPDCTRSLPHIPQGWVVLAPSLLDSY